MLNSEIGGSSSGGRGMQSSVPVLIQRVVPERRENNDFTVEKCLVETILTEPDYNTTSHANFNDSGSQQPQQQHSNQVNNANNLQEHVRNVQVQNLMETKPLEHREIILEGFVVDPTQHIDMQNGGVRVSEPAKKRVYKNPEGFPCDLCSYRAKMKSHLRAHRQSVHEGIKYPCEHCDYKATAMGSLRRHYNAIHSGLKYRCSECEHVSNTPANLKYHHNTVHMGLRFPCNKCDYKATTSSHLKKHRESVHEGVKYKCNECDHESTTKESLKVHKRSLHKKIMFPCPKCDYVAKVSSHIKQHIRSVHDKIRFPCDSCDYSAINNSRLKHHKETVHSGLKFTCEEHSVPITTARQLKQIMREDVKFECRSCELVARNSMQLLKRQKIVKTEGDEDDEYDAWGEGGVEGVVEGVAGGMVAVPPPTQVKKEVKVSKLQCDICYHEARNSAELKQHMMVLHEGTVFQCDFCTFKTSHQSSLKRHKQTVHPLSDLKIYCDNCIHSGAQISPKVENREELRRVLELTQTQQCEECKQISRQSLEQMKFHEENNKVQTGDTPLGRFACDVCGYDGRNFNDLKQHKLTVHEGVTYACDLCDYVAARPEALKRHRKTKHEERKFVCDHCPHRAHTAVKLSQHKLTAHVGVRYPCNMCNYSTARPNKLKEHKMMFHTADNQNGEFPCDECDKVFLDARSLKEHKADHGKVTPTFQCQHCRFNTTEVLQLQNHINSVHRKTMAVRQCGFCQYQCMHAGELQHHLNKVHAKRLALNQGNLINSGGVRGESVTIATVSLGCEHCNFKCLTPQELQAHLQTVHNVSPTASTNLVQAATNQAALQAAVNQAAAQAAASNQTVTHINTAGDANQQQQDGVVGGGGAGNQVPGGKQQTKLGCTECNFVAASEQALNQHKATNHEGERYPCDLSNHQDRTSLTAGPLPAAHNTRQTPAPGQDNKVVAEAAKPKLFTINTQEYEQAALSGILSSPFRGQIPVGNMAAVPAGFTTYSIHTPGSIPAYQIVSGGGSGGPATSISVPTFNVSTSTSPTGLQLVSTTANHPNLAAAGGGNNGNTNNNANNLAAAAAASNNIVRTTGYQWTSNW